MATSTTSTPLSLPRDLVDAERERAVVYHALAMPRPQQYTDLRRRLLRLTARVHYHPYWSARPAGAAAARVDLRRDAGQPDEGCAS
ncbi:hypothetical protein [Streptomyces sp. NPDC087294]|uniref:hypothetical protein n=1 Tax=Streptomyces sp. NPDC087294 TaxID=3365777 RepID=UPI0037F41F8D